MSDNPDYPKIKAIFETHREALINRPDVNFISIGHKAVGGQTTDKLAIVIAVNRKKPDSELSDGERLPREIGGFPTDVVEMEVVDPFRHLNKGKKK